MTEYLTADEIHALHADIVASDQETEAGIRNADAVESALVYISEGYFGERPTTVHEKAAHLMRLLVSEHPYVDGNKRTALTAVAVFYDLNGLAFDPDDRVRRHLREFATDAESAAIDDVIAYLRERTDSRGERG